MYNETFFSLWKWKCGSSKCFCNALITGFKKNPADLNKRWFQNKSDMLKYTREGCYSATPVKNNQIYVPILYRKCKIHNVLVTGLIMHLKCEFSNYFPNVFKTYFSLTVLERLFNVGNFTICCFWALMFYIYSM